jgi:DNA-binding NarL/FixJ family response regulator
MPRRVVARFIENTTAFKQPLPALAAPEISRREREVLRLLVEGCSNKEIANELRIIESTVKSHVAQLLRKTGVANRTALSVQAVSMALLGEQDGKAGKSRR